MYELKSVGPEFLREVHLYPGLVSVLVYLPSANVFEEKIRRNYHALHMQSGSNLLVVAGRSDWTSEDAARRMKEDVRRHIHPGQIIMKHMVMLSKDDEFEHAGNLIDLRTRFGLEIAETPCLVFLTDIEGTRGHVFSFDRSSISQTTDALMEQVSEVFDICGRAVENDPFPLVLGPSTQSEETDRALIAWREKVMLTVAPNLRKLKVFSSVRKLGPIVAGEAIKGLIGL